MCRLSMESSVVLEDWWGARALLEGGGWRVGVVTFDVVMLCVH